MTTRRVQDRPHFAPRSHSLTAALLAAFLLLAGAASAAAPDTTPPLPGIVNDGPGPDADWQNFATSLSANWSGFSDPESGIAGYRWAVGSTPGATDVLPFTAVGTATSAIQFGLPLVDGSTYYVTVEATNGVGLTTTVTSDGITIDLTPPTAPTPIAPTGGTTVAGSTGVSFAWSPIADAVSYRFQLSADPAFPAPTLVDVILAATNYASASLPAGTYFWRVFATDAAGNTSAASTTATFLTSGSTLGSLAVSLGPNSPFPSGELNSVQDLAVLQLRFSAAAPEDIEVSSLVLTALGTADDATQISQVRLVADVDSDGAYTPGIDLPLGSVTTFPVDNGTVAFQGFSLIVPAGQSRDILLTYSLNGSAPIGATLAARLAISTQVVARGMTSGQTLLPTGTLPIDGSTITVVSSGSPGGLAVHRGPQSPAAGFVAAGEQTVEMVQIQVTASSVEAVRLTGLVVRASGTGNDTVDVTNVFLAEDANGNGVFNAGTDPVLANGTYSADDGALSFSFSRTLQPGQSLLLLAVYDLSGTAAAGKTFVATVKPAEVSAVGLTSGAAIGGAGADIAGSTMSVGTVGVTAVGVVVSPVPLPPPDPVLPTARNVPALAFEITVGSLEGVTVQLVRVKASGSCNDPTDIQRLQLWQDVDGDGAIGPNDRLAAALEHPFPTNDGEAVFVLSETLAAGSDTRWIVTVDVAPEATGGTTFQASLAPASVPAPLLASGTSSNLFATISGKTAAGPAVAILTLPGSSGQSDGHACGATASVGSFGLPMATFGIAAAILLLLVSRPRIRPFLTAALLLALPVGLVSASQIAAGVSSMATAYSAQRKVVRTTNGASGKRLFVLGYSGSALNLYYSDDPESGTPNWQTLPVFASAATVIGDLVWDETNNCLYVAYGLDTTVNDGSCNIYYNRVSNLGNNPPTLGAQQIAFTNASNNSWTQPCMEIGGVSGTSQIFILASHHVSNGSPQDFEVVSGALNADAPGFGAPTTVASWTANAATGLLGVSRMNTNKLVVFFSRAPGGLLEFAAVRHDDADPIATWRDLAGTIGAVKQVSPLDSWNRGMGSVVGIPTTDRVWFAFQAGPDGGAKDDDVYTCCWDGAGTLTGPLTLQNYGTTAHEDSGGASLCTDGTTLYAVYMDDVHSNYIVYQKRLVTDTGSAWDNGVGSPFEYFLGSRPDPNNTIRFPGAAKKIYSGRLDAVSTSMFENGLFHFSTTASFRVWSGSGNWSNGANWTPAGAPAGTDIALFNNTSVNPCTIDVPVGVDGIFIQSGYTGAITTNAGLTAVFGSSGFFQGGGTFTATSGRMEVGGQFARIGGTFTTAAGGTLMLSSVASQTIDPAGATFNNVTINDGLLGYWKFDEAAGPTAFDSSGRANNAAYNGAPLPTTTAPTLKFPNPNSLQFDGSSWVDAGSIPGSDTGSTLSVSFWMRPTALAAQQGLISKWEPANTGNQNTWAVRTGNAGDPTEIKVFIATAADGGNNEFTSLGAGLANNVWSHIAFVYTGAGATNAARLAVYKDGLLLQGDGTVGPGGYLGTIPSSLFPSTSTVTVGRQTVTTFPNFVGQIDDVRIYNRALSAMEVEALALGSQPGTGLATYTLASNLPVGGTLTLNSGTLDAGTVPGNITVGASWLNNGAKFNARGGTVTFNGAGGGNSILSGGQSFNNLTVNGIGSWACQDTANVEGAFSQSAGTFTAPATRIEVAGDFSVSGGTFSHNNGTLFLRPNGAHTVTPVATTLNNVTINDGMVGYWKLDEAAGPTAADSSGRGMNGTYSNGPVPAAGGAPVPFPNPGSLQFTGAFDSVQVPDDPALRPSAITVSTWIKLNGLTPNAQTPGGATLYPNLQYIVFKRNSSTNGLFEGYSLTYNGTFQFTLSSGAGGTQDQVASVTSPATGTWYHVAATFQQPNFNIYVNGKLEGSGTHNFPLDYGPRPLFLGRSGEDGSAGTPFDSDFNGSLDDVRIYNRVLSANEIGALARGQQPATASGTCTLGSALTAAGTITLHSGGLDVGAGPFAINAGANWYNYGGLFAGRTGTVAFNSASAGNQILSGGQSFNTVTFATAGSWSCLDPMTCTGNFVQSNGTFMAPSGPLAVGGALNRTGGTFTPNGGTLVLNGTSSQVHQPGGATYNNVTINDGLLAYWKLDETAGTTAFDSSGYGHHGVRNGIAAADTVDKPVLNFDDTASLRTEGTSTYVDTGFTSYVPTFTAAIWAKGTSVPGATGNKCPMTKEENFQIAWDHTDPVFRGCASVRIAGVWYPATYGALNAGTWYHMAASYDGTTLKSYLNGVLITSTPTGGGSPDNVFRSIMIGRHEFNTGDLFDGRLDDARIYNRVLSGAEIAALAAGNEPGTSLAIQTLAASLTAAGDVMLNAGTLAPGANSITVGGNWLAQGGLFTPGSSTVTLNGSGTNVILSGGQSFNNLTATGSGSWSLSDVASVNGAFTQSAGTFTAGRTLTVTGNASLQNGALALVTGGQIRMGSGSTLAIGDGVGGAATAILSASGSPKPIITTSGTPGTNFYGFIVNSDGRLNVSGLQVFSTNTNGLTLNVGATLNNGTAGTLSGVDFDQIQAGGTYLRFLPTSGNFFVSNCTFGNTGTPNPFNISTPSGTVPASLLVDARTNNTGVRAASTFENDHGAGEDDAVGTSTIKWLLPPNPPSAINQYLSDATTVIPVGSGTNGANVVFKATATDPDGDNFQLDVEFQLVGTPFTNVPTVSSAPVASGATASVSSGAIATGNYHWQYRLTDATARSTAWTSFGANLESATDFSRDTTAPTITSVTSATASGSYTIGAVIDVTVNFSEPVNLVGGNLLVTLDTGTVVSISPFGPATSASGTYTVLATQNSGGLIATSPLALSAGTLRDLSGNDCVLTIPGGQNIPNFKAIVIDTTAPTISNVTSSTASGTYGAGSVINVTVNFSEPVTLAGGNLQVTLDTGTVVSIPPFGPASTASGTYTVTAGQTSAGITANNPLTLSAGTLRDAAGNNGVLTIPGGQNIINFKTIVIDTTAPTITSVTSTTAAGSYGAGAVINVTVNFSEAVTLAGGNLQVTLNTGTIVSIPAFGPATSASGTYTVTAGQNNAALNANSPLTLSAGTLRDAANNNCVLTIPGGQDIANFKTIVIDTTAPTITNVTSSTANGSYTVGAVINVTVNFSEPVTLVGGNLQVTLDTGTIVSIPPFGPAATASGTYTVTAGQTSGGLNANSPLTLSAGTLRDAAGNNCVLTIPGGQDIANLKAIVIDTTAPTITNVTSSTANGSYTVGANINVTVNFSEPVTLTGGNLQVTLDTGTVVSITPFGPSATASGTYVVTAGQTSAALNANSPLALSAGTLRDAAGNNCVLTIPGGQDIANLKAIVVDTTAPTITSVTSTTAAGAYTTGALINVTVNFSEPVTLAGGNLQVTLDTGAVVSITPFGPASTASGTYTVTAGQTSAGITANSPLTLSAGTLRDAAGNNGVLTIPGGQNIVNFKTIVVDTTPPTISNVTSTTANGAYGAGSVINVTVNFSEPVTLTGGNLQVTLNTTTVVTITPFGPATSATGTYTVLAGQNAAALNANSPLTLTAGTLRDAAGNDCVLTIPGGQDIANLKAIVIDTTAPTITSVTSTTANGTYGAGSLINVTVNFSEPVTLAGGNLQVTLDTGTIVSIPPFGPASTIGGTYTVTAGQTSGGLNANSPLTLSAGTLTDAAGNNCVLTIPGGQDIANLKAIVIDTTAPSVTSVTSTTADGAYTVGANINVTVNFSEAVTLVGGNLQVTLNTGAIVSIPPFGPATSASGTYVVGAGQNTGALNANSPLTLSAGTLRDSANNNCVLSIPVGQDIANLKAIVIDTTAPTISNVTSTTANGAYTTGALINVTVNFSEPVTLTGGNLQVTLNTTTVVTIAPFGPATSATGTYTVLAGQNTAALNANSPLTLSAGTLRDAAGNDCVLTIPVGQDIANLKAIVVDTTPPTISNVTSSTANGSYGAGALINVTVNFSEPVTLAGGNLQVTLNTGSILTIAPFGPATSASATYTVLAGQNAAALNATSPLTLTAGTLRDPAGNNCVLTIPVGQDIANLKAIVIDTTPPAVASVTSATGNGAYGAGANIDVTVNFSEPVTLTGGNLLVTLDTGAVVSIAPFGPAATASGTYVVLAGQNSASLNANSPLTLSAGTLRDAAGNDCTLTIPAGQDISDLRAIVIDTIAPTITSVTSSTANGAYTVGANINITVNFSEAVTLAGGNLQVTLDTGAVVSIPPFGPGTTITGNYLVVAGQNSPGLNAVSPLALSAGTLRDAAGNSCTLTIPAGQDIANLKAIVIDTIAPTVTINQAAGQTDPTSLSPITFTVTFSENVSGFTSGGVVLGGTAGATTAVVSGGPAVYTVSVSGMTVTGSVTATVSAGAATDVAGNPNVASTSTDNTVTFLAIIDRYWIATAPGLWSDTANWSDTASGAGGFSVPGSNTRVFYGADATKGGNCTIDAPVNVRSISVAAGYTGTITQGVQTVTIGVGGFAQAGGIVAGGNAAVTINGPFALSGGTFTSTSATLSLSGDFTITGGTYTANLGTVSLTGTTAGLALQSGGQTLNALTISGTGSWIQNGALALSGDFSQTSGLFTANALVSVQGNVTIAGAGNPSFVLAAASELRLGLGKTLAVGAAVNPGTLAASGAPKPKITTVGVAGTDSFSFVVGAAGTLNVNALQLLSLSATGLTLNGGSSLNNGTAGAISGVDFDQIQSGGTYLRFLHASGSFTVSNCTFSNTGAPNPFNISTPGGTAPPTLLVDARTNNAGARAGDVYENDHGVGTDSAPATSTIRWSSPSAPSAIGQFRTDGVTVIPVGGATGQASLIFGATATDPDGDNWQIAVEIQPLGTPFANAATVTSPLVASGGTASVSSGALADGSYHWQFQLIDSTGSATGWISFGGNPEAAVDFLKDTTPPIAGTVNDGPGPDLSVQNYSTSISANWSGFSDPESGIAGYRWAVGTSPGATDVLPFTTVGTTPGAIATVALVDGTTYYVTVEATNGAGLVVTASSNGVLVDTTPPAAPVPGGPSGGVAVPGATGVTFSWAPVPGAVSYRFQLSTNPTFTAPLTTDVVVSTTSYTSGALAAAPYYWRVFAIDAAGNVSAASSTANFQTTGSSTGALTITAGPDSPFASNEINTAQGLPVLQLRITAATEDVQVTSVTLSAFGSGDDAANVQAVRLYYDANSDGAVDPADLQLGSAQTFPVDDGPVTFQGFSLIVPAGQSRDILLVYDLNGTAPIGSTFAARLAIASQVIAQGMTTGLPLLPQGSFPIDGAPLTIVSSGSPGGLSLRAGVSTPSGGYVAPGEQTVEMVQVRLAASSVESLRVTGLTIHASGTGNDAADVVNVFLAEDANGNGIYDAGTDPVLASGTYSADNGSVTFALSRTLAPGQVVHWLVVYDLSASVAVGSTFTLQIQGTDLAAIGLTSGAAIPVTGPTVSGALQTVGIPGTNPSQVTVSAVTLPQGAPVWPTSQDVPALSFDLQVGALEGVTLQLLRLKSSGPARDDLVITRLKLWEDVDGSGTVTSGDRLIAVLDQPFPQDDAEAALVLSEILVAGGSLRLLVTVDISGQADGGFVQLSINPTGAPTPLAATGSLSGLFATVSGATVVGPQILFQPLEGSTGHRNRCMAQVSTGYTSSGPGIPGPVVALALAIVLACAPPRRMVKRK